MDELERWMAAVVEELGVQGPADLVAARDLLLDVAREVAHAVDRPAAPVTAFLLGLAAGPGAAGLDRHAQTVRRLAAAWPGAPPAPAKANGDG
jgi:hypothetical protein